MTSALALLSVFLLAAGPVTSAGDGFKSGVFDPPRIAPSFTLQGSQGAALKLEDYRGKVVVLGFGYTHCHSVCPITLANLAQVQRKLGAAASGVQVIYVTVDPERDSAARLKEYLALFNPAFLGATGSGPALDQVRQEYGVVASKLAPEGHAPGNVYDVHHSSFIYLIDREGKLRLLVPFGKAPDDIVHDIELLLGGK